MASLPEIRRKILLFTNRFFIPIAVVLVICIFIASYFTFIEKEIANIKNIGVVDFQKKKNELSEKNALLDKIKKVHESYLKINKDEIKKISLILPEEKDTASLFMEVESLARKSGLLLNGVDIAQGGAISVPASGGTDSPALNINKLNINLKIQGIDKYDKLKLFLNNIEKEIRILDLNSLTYSPGTDSYALSLITYYQGTQ